MLARSVPTARRTRGVLLRPLCRARAALWCARAAGIERWEAARGDERGLTTAEYVVLGAFVVVAAALIGTALYAFLQQRAGVITNTQPPGSTGS